MLSNMFKLKVKTNERKENTESLKKRKFLKKVKKTKQVSPISMNGIPDVFKNKKGQTA